MEISNVQSLLYLNDIIVFSSSVEQHLERLEVVLGRLEREGLKAKLEKCVFLQSQVRYLGISAKGVATDPSKVQAVSQGRRPSKVTELRSFLGFASYYWRFVEGFGKIHRLVAEFSSAGSRPKKLVGLDFSAACSEQCQQCFEELKVRLTTAPVLAYADFSQRFILEVDASHGGLGAVLSQEQDGKLRPVAYASRSLRPTERNMSNYSSMKLEFLALKWAMTEKFREYLLGSRCVVFTDNNPLSHLSTAKLGATEQRWAAQLAAFDFEIHYRSGKSNKNVDALSRQNPPEEGVLGGLVPGTVVPAALQQVVEAEPVVEVQQAMIATLPNYSLTEFGALQVSDPIISEILPFWRRKARPGVEESKQMSALALTLLRQWDRFVERSGALYRRVYSPNGGEEVLQLLLPVALKVDVLTQLHQQHGHQGIERTGELVRQRCYWPGMSSDIVSWCQECERCQFSKDTQPPVQSFMGHLLASRPN